MEYDSIAHANGDVFLKAYTDAEYQLDGGEAFYTVIHEIGHAIGLAHPFHSGEINPEIHSSLCQCASCSNANKYTFGSNSEIGASTRDSSIFTVMSYGVTAGQEVHQLAVLTW